MLEFSSARGIRGTDTSRSKRTIHGDCDLCGTVVVAGITFSVVHSEVLCTKQASYTLWGERDVALLSNRLHRAHPFGLVAQCVTFYRDGDEK